MGVQVELRMPVSLRLRTLQGGGWDVPFCSCPRSATGVLGPPTRLMSQNGPRTFALRGEGVRHGGVTPRKRRLCPAPRLSAVVQA
jgi:hypothetical protein